MIHDLWKPLFPENQPPPPPESLYYLTFSELKRKRGELWKEIQEYENSSFFRRYREPGVTWFPDPDITYEFQLEKLILISFVMKKKHRNWLRFQGLLKEDREELLNTAISLIETDSKIRYAEIAELDESLTIALDYLIEKKRLWRAGKPENSYWKLKQK